MSRKEEKRSSGDFARGDAGLVPVTPAAQGLYPYFKTLIIVAVVLGIGGYAWINSEARAAMLRRQKDAQKAEILGELQIKREEDRIEDNRALRRHLAERAAGLLELLDDLDAKRMKWSERRCGLDESLEGRELAASESYLGQLEQLELIRDANRLDAEPIRKSALAVAEEAHAKLDDVIVAAPADDVRARVELNREKVLDALAFEDRSLGSLEVIITVAIDDRIKPSEASLAEALRRRVSQRAQAGLAVLADASEEGDARQLEELSVLAKQATEERLQAELFAEKKRHAQELEALRARLEGELESERLQLEKDVATLREQNAELQREAGLLTAETELRNTEAALERQRIADEEEHARLLAKAQSPEVLAALEPFIGDGFFMGDGGTKPGPMSLSRIRAAGALEDTPQGLRNLYKLGMDGKGANDRPGAWPRSGVGRRPTAQWIKNQSASVDKARQASGFLSELESALISLNIIRQ